MKKRVLSFALAVLMVVACVPAVALSSSAASTDLSKQVTWYNGKTGEVAGAANDDNTDSCEDISYAVSEGYAWSLDDDGVLTVSGEGDMPNLAKDEWPWHSLRSQITKVVVLFGITSIGSHAFEDCDNMTEIVIPEGVTTLGGDAFAYNAGLTTITLPSTITTIKQGVVYSSPAIETVYIPGDPATFEEGKTIGAYNDAFKVAGGKLTQLEYTQIQVSTFFGEPNPGWQNWNGAGFETVLFVRITDTENNPVRNIPLDATWKLTFAASGSGKSELGVGKKTITLNPFLQVGGYEENYAFKPCLGEGENQFVPIKGVTYTLAIEVYDEDGTLLYKSAPGGGFKCGVDPKVPEGTYPTNLFLNPQCYIETDLGSPMPIDSVSVANYPQGTVYKWLVYATNDNTLPIDQWTIIGGKTTDEKSTELADGHYTSEMAFNEDLTYDKYQYVRIYGLYHSGNVGFHFNDVKLTVAVEGNSHLVTWVVDGVSSTDLVTDGETPVFEGTPYKTPTYTKEYVFTGWDKEIVPCTEPATYTAQFEERDRGARTIEIGNTWWTMENWDWDASEKETQLLLSFKAAGDPTFNQDNKINTNGYANYRWEVTFIWEEDGVEKSSTHAMQPWSQPSGGTATDYRIRLTSGPDAFFPVNGTEYKIGLKLYDVTLPGYGPEGYLAYEGVSTKTVKCGVDPMYMAESVSPDDICTITWQMEGETVYTAKVLKGIVPTYPGVPFAPSKWVDGKRYVLTTETEIVAATGDATYNMVYAQDSKISISNFNNTTWQNWNDDTQLLMQIWDSTGAPTRDIWDNRDNFTWAVVIDGTEYICAPDSEYIYDGMSIYRFEIAKYGVFVPTAGATYSIGLKIYDKQGNVAFATTENMTSVVPEDLVPIVSAVKGDVNNTGIVDIDDVTDLLKYLAGTGEIAGNGDVDGSGTVDITDVTELLKILAGN